MRLKFAIELAVYRFKFNGRLAVYGNIHFGSTWFYIQRWDTERCPKNRFLTKDGVMGWTWGMHRPKKTVDNAAKA